MMAFGLALIAAPQSVLADVVPFVGSIVGFIGGLAALVAAFVLSVLTIAVAWFAVRPVPAGIMVAVAVLAGAAFA